jgi:hypothetical protein
LSGDILREVIAVLLFVLFLSCTSGSEGSTWLIATASGVISVSQAGEIWNGLEQSERNSFLAADSPVGDFVSSLGTNTVMLEEIDNELYLNSSIVKSMKKCWIRNACSRAYIDSLSVSVRDDISPEDISYYMSLLGPVVWFSSPATGAVGPVRLPDLPWSLAFALDSMIPGSSVVIDGITYTLDSCVTPSMVPNSDFAIDYSFAISSLTRSRVKRAIRQLTAESIKHFSLDSASVTAWCTFDSSPEDDVVLASWNDSIITASELEGITAFVSLGLPLIDIDPKQTYSMLREQAELSIIQDIYSSLYQNDYSVILLNADRFAVDISTEMLFEDSVSNRIQITDSMVVEEYLGMESVPEVPENRTFFSVAATEITLCRELLSESNIDSLISESDYTGYFRFLAPGSRLLSEPVTASELPSVLSMELFNLSSVDTVWHGPVKLNRNLFVIFKLCSIYPAHPVPFEKLKDAIRHRLFIHRQEQMEMNWIRELENQHSLEINNEVLGQLPSDISLWINL